jgi:adenylate cyclase class 2
LLGYLGFEPVATVSKSRQCVQLVREGLPVEIALDEVDNVGTFVELEICTEDKPAAIERAKQVLATLAQQLGLNQVERRSYLELLLEKN